jgi:hypothetical protein
MIVECGHIVAGGSLIFFFPSFLFPNKYVYHCLICFLLFNFGPYYINFLFCSFFIYRSSYSFQFSPSIVISCMFGFSFRSLFF